LSNTNTGGTVIHINDATSNTVRYCAIQGVTATSGVVLFSTGDTVGNDSNTIEYCSIGDGITTPTNAIYWNSVGTDNSNITISNNNIYNYFSATASSNGIFIGSNLSLNNK
jgi:hypothetical protein